MRFYRVLIFLLAFAAGAIVHSAFADESHCIVKNKTIHTIDDRLFGSFMERPSWGETGPESALVPGTDHLQPAVVELLREMKIPIIRFPGGTDADFLDWRDMVSNVPGRSAARPVSVGHENNEVSNNFGYDEFLQLSKSLGWQNIIVVNFRAGLFKQLPLEEAAHRAASLVAYCNAPLGAKLPPGMIDWPAVRAKNGHPQPYKVKFWQIGNETWFFQKKIEELAPNDPERYYANCLLTYARAMLAVDPEIEFIADGTKGGQLARTEMPDKIRHLVFHAYEPWAIREVERDHKQIDISSLTPSDVWYAWVATPGFTADGVSVFHNELIPQAHQENFKIAVTEWNWNGWWEPRNHYPTPAFAKAVGAAGFVHALMRSSDVIDIACQSMLVGSAWDIHAIGADPTGKTPPYFMPTGQLMALYANHHGPRLLELETSGVPTYRQPFKMSDIHPAKKVAMLDILSTANDKTVYLHVINRDFEKDQKLSVDVSDFGRVAGTANCYSLTGRMNKRPYEDEPTQISRIAETNFPVKSGKLLITLPARSVSCVEIPLAR